MNAVPIPQPISISTVKACTLLLLSAVSLALATDTASAQSATWEDGRPVFRSDGRSSVSTPGMGLWGEDEDSSPGRFPTLMSGGARPYVTPETPEVVSFASSEPAGTILIDTAARRLYYTLPNSKAYEYPISVGREGFTWTGVERISRVVDWPDWHPPAEMRERQPELPKKMTGGIRNPLGVRALYLGSTLYRIHGTNDTRTIGQAASSGCFRMMNGHVMHLSRLAEIGTVVKVMRRLPNRRLAGTGTQG